MDNLSIKCIVYFENPFWVGVFEKNINRKISAIKITFGAEPNDNQVFEFILKNYNKLKYSKEIINDKKINNEKINPKRVQRKVKKELNKIGISTKSQQVLKFQQEQNKIIRKTKTKEMKELEKEKMFLLKQKKKKEKHKGK